MLQTYRENKATEFKSAKRLFLWHDMLQQTTEAVSLLYFTREEYRFIQANNFYKIVISILVGRTLNYKLKAGL